MERIQVNVTTGERQVIQLTPQEIAQAQEQAATHEDSITYAQRRAAAYPSLAEQMDMQYWDSVNGTTVWADTIAAIKAAHPKPGA